MKKEIEKKVLEEEQERIKDHCFGRPDREVKIKSIEEIEAKLVDSGYGNMNIHAVNIQYLLNLIKRLKQEQQKTAQDIVNNFDEIWDKVDKTCVGHSDYWLKMKIRIKEQIKKKWGCK